jgi:hypothetical protein
VAAVRAIASAGRQRARRALTTPFAPDRPKPLLVHVAHHRAGTVWFFNIYREVAHAYGLRVAEFPTTDVVPPRTDVALYEHSRTVNRGDIGDRAIRGTHLIRDPRDVIVSSYFYHRWTSESWVHVPDPRYGGLSLQEYLRSMSKADGLMAEVRRYLNREAPEVVAWNYGQPDILELRYEEVLADEDGTFRRMFGFLGFSADGIDRAVSIARSQSFHRLTGRRLGQVGSDQHLRSGEPGQWKEHFETEHLEVFNEGAGDLLARLRYEPGGIADVATR